MSFARKRSRTGRSSPSATVSNETGITPPPAPGGSSAVHEAVVDDGDHLAALVRHREADDHEVHAAGPPRLLVHLVQRRANADRVTPMGRDAERDVLSRVQPRPHVYALRDVLGVALVALVAQSAPSI